MQKSYKSMFTSLFSKQEIYFGSFFLGIFLITFIGLYLIGLMPTEFQSSPGEGTTALQNLENGTKNALAGNSASSNIEQPIQTTTTKTSIENPVSISIPVINTNVTIINPTTTNADVLDQDLAKGVVRYPGSGLPGQGNMFIFGHSTSFSIVHNKAYQAFNNLNKLKTGDQIHILTNNKDYLYSVRSVVLKNENDTLVSFSQGKNMLTLSTCNSFGAKTDRYVVEADYVLTSDR